MNKTIIYLLVLSILTLSADLYGEKRGAELIIQKKDEAQVRGELIAVKENSLLLLEREPGADLSIEIERISVITIVKKSKFWMGAGIGFLIGGGAGAIVGAANADADKFDLPTEHAVLLVGGMGGIIGAVIGGFIGKATGKDEKLQIEEKSDPEIKEVLEKLKSKARMSY